MEVHGLTAEFLADKPRFAEIAEEFLAFIGDATLVIHNAEFDRRFLNAELDRLGLPLIPRERCVDTLAIARSKFPGAPCSLDALCKRFAIDNSHRDLHGALIDAKILAEVYLELVGGRQRALGLVEAAAESARTTRGTGPQYGPRPRPLGARLDDTARRKHADFIATLGDSPLWRKWLTRNETEREEA